MSKKAIDEFLRLFPATPPRPPVPKVDNADFKYLLKLNNKLTYMTWMNRPRPNMRDNGGPDRIPVMNYSDYKLSDSELERILNATVKHDLPIVPANVCSGFEVGYNILLPADQPIPPYTTLATFNESQLPTLDWKKVWDVVTRPRNLELLTFYKLGPVREHSSYEY